MNDLNKKLLLFEDFFFVLLIFLIPSQLAYHFWPNWAFVGGVRVDYFAPTIYLTDILIVVILALFVLRTVITNGVRIGIKTSTIAILGVLTILVIANINYSLSN